VGQFIETSTLAAFLLAFPALFSIVNPPGAAFIFNEVTGELSHAEKTWLAGKVGFYALIVMLAALWGGSYVLNFFGISLAALRVAGGAVVALRAWDMLMAPERQEARKTDQAGVPSEDMGAMAFFPLTMPFTTGPGTIAVAVALGAERPNLGQALIGFFFGMSAAAGAIALMVWLGYRWADLLVARMGAAARRTVSRMSAFLLLCIGVQILMTGIEEEFHMTTAIPR
jgi:multiple antibiotic resistance protein